MGFPAFFLVKYMAREKIKVIREEMLQVANSVAQEKNIDKDEVFGAMELALEKAARVKYGFERDIRVKIDRENGDINLSSYLKVVDAIDIEEEKNQILLESAKKIQSQLPEIVSLTRMFGTPSDNTKIILSERIGIDCGVSIPPKKTLNENERKIVLEKANELNLI